MFITDAILSVYGLLLLSGAYFGKKAGSNVSMYMGIITGALIFLGLYLTTDGSRLGYNLISTVSGLLIIVFMIRVIKTKKMMPAGMLLIASVIASLVSILG